mgnify:CR=1 FL=1
MSEKSSSAGAAKSKAPSSAKAAATKPSTSKKESAKSASDTGSASDASAEKSAESGAEKSAESGAEKSADSGAKKSAESGGGKAQKETVSSSDVHYGYFSSVRTPAYRKGWDDIFGKKQSSGDDAKKIGTADRAKSARKTKKSTIKQPITLELDIAKLPDALRAALNEEIRRKVKRRRVNYDKLDKAGAVRWNIVCEIER